MHEATDGWRNLFVKTPSANYGMDAISACLAEGTSINVAPLFLNQLAAAGAGRSGTRGPLDQLHAG